MLKINHVSIEFENGINAVKDVSIQVHNQERLVIIGETGSGKSVLLLAILKLLPKNTKMNGNIFFKEKDILSLSKKEMLDIRGRQIAYIPQGSGNALNPLYTIGHQISESIIKYQKVKKNEAAEKAEKLVSDFGMKNAKKVCRSYPFMLSGGMRQRVLIAMGIAGEAELILADEPTKGLDQRRIDMVIDSFQKIQNRSILCVTHDLRFAKEISDRIVVMYASQKIENASKEDFFNEPLHPYAKAMINALPENGLWSNFGFAPPKEESLEDKCKFIYRCPYRKQQCEKMPPLFHYKGREVRCWLYAD